MKAGPYSDAPLGVLGESDAMQNSVYKSVILKKKTVIEDYFADIFPFRFVYSISRVFKCPIISEKKIKCFKLALFLFSFPEP